MYRAVSASVIFDTLWSLISFGHRESRSIGSSQVMSDLFSTRTACTWEGKPDRRGGRLLPRSAGLHVARHLWRMLRSRFAQAQTGLFLGHLSGEIILGGWSNTWD